MAYGAIIGQTPTVQASAEMTSYNNDNTSSVITADNVQGAIDQLFTSVSNGKSQIASAITGMGVSTSANDSFAQMATNIGNIGTGPDWSEVESPAGAAQILAPYQTYDSSNKLIKGTITSKGAQTYTPRTVSQTISSGQYLSGNQTIQGDENLKASNIKSGVSIFGVGGSLQAAPTQYISTSARESGASLIIDTPDLSGKTITKIFGFWYVINNYRQFRNVYDYIKFINWGPSTGEVTIYMNVDNFPSDSETYSIYSVEYSSYYNGIYLTAEYIDLGQQDYVGGYNFLIEYI